MLDKYAPLVYNYTCQEGIENLTKKTFAKVKKMLDKLGILWYNKVNPKKGKIKNECMYL